MIGSSRVSCFRNSTESTPLLPRRYSRSPTPRHWSRQRLGLDLELDSLNLHNEKANSDFLLLMWRAEAPEPLLWSWTRTFGSLESNSRLMHKITFHYFDWALVWTKKKGFHCFGWARVLSSIDPKQYPIVFIIIQTSWDLTRYNSKNFGLGLTGFFWRPYKEQFLLLDLSCAWDEQECTLCYFIISQFFSNSGERRAILESVFAFLDFRNSPS